MDNAKERPSIAAFNCPNCNALFVIAPVFGTHHNARYEAWAKLWFAGGEVGRNGRIIYEGEESKPSTAAKKITGYHVNGWSKFWRYEGKKGVITLDELAISLK